RDGRLVIWSVSAEDFDVDGHAMRVVVAADVTALRRSEEERTRVVRELIGAQERERHRIARDLHDDLGQRFAVMLMELAPIRRDAPAGSSSVGARIDDLSRQLADTAIDLRRLSHELYSPKLTLLDAEHALEGLCADVRRQLSVDVDFKSHDVPRPVQPAI